MAVVRELTKVHEEVWRGSLAEAADVVRRADAPRGEVVLVVGGAPPAAPADERDVEAAVRTALRRRLRRGAAAGRRSCGREPRRPATARLRGGAARALRVVTRVLTSGRGRARRYATGGAALLPDHADLLRQRRAARGHGVHDGQRRRAGPLAPPARGRRLVHDRHGRARGEDRRGGRGATAPRPRSGRTAPRPASSRPGAASTSRYDDFIRTTEPRHYEVVQAVPPADLRQRVHRAGAVLGPVLRVAARTTTPRTS